MGPRVAGIEGHFFKTGFCFHLLGGSFNENPPILMQLEDQWAHLLLKLHLISWKMVERQVSRATPIQSGSSAEIFLPVLLKLFWCNFAFQVSGWSWFWTTRPPGHLTTWPPGHLTTRPPGHLANQATWPPGSPGLAGGNFSRWQALPGGGQAGSVDDHHNDDDDDGDEDADSNCQWWSVDFLFKDDLVLDEYNESALKEYHTEEYNDMLCLSSA